MTRIAALAALHPADRRLCLQALAAGAAIRTALRLLGYKRCRDWLDRLARVPGAEYRASPEAGQPARVARLVRAAARNGPFGRNCLVDALTLWWLLRRQGIVSDIRIGVRKDAGALDAHAWVECGGLALDEPADLPGPFAPLGRTKTA